MATSGIWNHAVPANSLAAGSAAHPNAATGSSNDESGAGANISGNDFLTLLVTEMKNQDPTANNDPNAYVNQLVQVNSLEQLISINETLTKGLGVSASGGMETGPGASVSAGAHPVTSLQARGAPQAGLPSAESPAGPGFAATAGNLAVPPASSAAHRVAHALGNRTPIG